MELERDVYCVGKGDGVRALPSNLKGASNYMQKVHEGNELIVFPDLNKEGRISSLITVS